MKLALFCVIWFIALVLFIPCVIDALISKTGETGLTKFYCAIISKGIELENQIKESKK